MKRVYKKVNGELTVKDSNIEEEANSSYLNLSDMFDGVKPLAMTELDSSEIDYYFKLLKKEDYKGYSYLLHTLMNKIITCKNVEELKSNRSGSFYNLLKTNYEANRYQRKIDEKHQVAKLNPTPEFMCTATRIVIRNYIDLIIDSLDDTNLVVNKNPYDVMKIFNTRLSRIKNSRLETDKKLDTYIKGIWNTKMSNLTVDTRGHKCGNCHFPCVQDCPKVAHAIIDGETLDNYPFITDGVQIVDVELNEAGEEEKTTERFIVTGCRLYRKFEEEYNKKQQESKYVVPSGTHQKDKNADKVLISKTKYGRIYRIK